MARLALPSLPAWTLCPGAAMPRSQAWRRTTASRPLCSAGAQSRLVRSKGCRLRAAADCKRYLPAAEPAAGVPSQEPGDGIRAPVGHLRGVSGPVEVLMAHLDAGVDAYCGFMASEELQQCIWAACCHPLSCMDHDTETSQHLSVAGSKEACKQHPPSNCRCDFHPKSPRSSSRCFSRGVAANRSCSNVQVIAQRSVDCMRRHVEELPFCLTSSL